LAAAKLLLPLCASTLLRLENTIETVPNTLCFEVASWSSTQSSSITQSPLGGCGTPLFENELLLKATGFNKLLAVEALAMGDGELPERLETTGYYDLAPIQSGTYSFSVADICRVKPNLCINSSPQFTVDSAKILVFDAEYLDCVLQHFEGKHAYRGNQVDRKREREHRPLIAFRDDINIQIQSHGINRGVAFAGDGEYYFRDGAFRPLAK
jgi:hypothetical protein